MNRRRFLRGLGGVLVGLPFLESLPGVRARSRVRAADDPRRFVVFFTCNGANMDTFWPTGAYGALTPAHFGDDRTLKPLLNYRDKLIIPRNMHMSPRGWGVDPVPACDHQKGMGQKLTCAPVFEDSRYATSISIDQFIANKVNPAGKPALNLGVHESGGNVLGCISYRGANDPVTSEINPRLAFQDLMNINYSGSSGGQVKDLLVERRKSVLDLVSADFDTLRAHTLSKADKQKLDLHFTTIRELEQGTMGGPGSMSCQPLSASTISDIQAIDQGVTLSGNDAKFQDVGRLQIELLALALACDQTRVATLQWGAGSHGPIFKWTDPTNVNTHHQLSHGSTSDDPTMGTDVADYKPRLFGIDRWYAGQYLALLDKLSAYAESSGTLLDQSCVLWINELSDGKAHDFRDLPTVMAGSCGGYFKTGQFLNLSKNADARQVYDYDQLDAPHNMLFTTIANAMGVPIDFFGAEGYGKKGEYSALKA